MAAHWLNGNFSGAPVRLDAAPGGLLGVQIRWAYVGAACGSRMMLVCEAGEGGEAVVGIAAVWLSKYGDEVVPCMDEPILLPSLTIDDDQCRLRLLETGSLNQLLGDTLHLYALPVLMDYITKRKISDLVVVSPDAGGVERARAFAKRLQANLAIIDKRREGPNQAQVMNIIGDVQGKSALLLDDMIDTAGTIVQGAQACFEKGAREVWAGCTHGVLSGPALERLQQSCLTEVLVTDSIPLRGKDLKCPKLKLLSVAPLFGEAIRRIHEDESVSSLFV